MAWDPSQQKLSTGPLTKVERQDTRRVLQWFEQRAFLRASLALWGKWLILLPSAMAAGWEIAVHFLHGN